MKTGADAPTSNPWKCLLMPDDIMTKDANPQGHDPENDWLLNQLNAIQPGMDMPVTATDTLQERRFKGFKNTGQSSLTPNPNDPDIIMPDAKLTRWDKASRRWRDLVAKREKLPPDHPPHKVALLDQQIVTARKALERAESDVSRWQEAIDNHRADAGRADYNRRRRKVRSQPNADLSDMTPKQKEQHGKDRRADANFVKRRRNAGIPEAKIQAELVVRIRAREAERAAKARAAEEQAELEQHPHYSLF